MDYHIFLAILVLICVDYVTGIIKGCMTTGFDSKLMREGLLHKLTYFIAILVSLCIEYLTGFMELGFVFGSGLTMVVSVWITVTEVGSILENVCVINPELADNSFMRLFATTNEQGKEETE